MTVELTWLQFQVAEVLKQKEMTAEEIAVLITDKNKIQIKNSLRYLLDKGLVQHDFYSDRYKLLFINYVMRKDVQNFLERTSEDHLIPCIKVYQPSDQMILDVRTLNHNGFKRSEIAKLLNIKKSDVLWTLINHTNTVTIDHLGDAIELDDVQQEVYKAIGKKYKNKSELEKRLKMPYDNILEIIFQLYELNAVNLKKVKDEYIFERLDIEIMKKERIKKNGN